MYHYVHNPDQYKVEFKSLKTSHFEKQIKYLKKHYEIIDPDDFFSLIDSKKPHKNYVLLTFDDGYKDHIRNVEPILHNHNIKAIFFIATSTLDNRSLLDVNKIQILLENFNDDKKLLNIIKTVISSPSDTDIKYKNPNSFDNEVRLEIKNLLQWKIKKNVRVKLLNSLYDTYCRNLIDINNFYMNYNDLKYLSIKGHHIGLHTHNHHNLRKLNSLDQKKEIIKSHNILKKKKLLNSQVSICYPYGQYNMDTISILKNIGIKFGFKIGNKNYTRKYNNHEIPRIDTKLI